MAPAEASVICAISVSATAQVTHVSTASVTLTASYSAIASADALASASATLVITTSAAPRIDYAAVASVTLSLTTSGTLTKKIGFLALHLFVGDMILKTRHVRGD